MDKFDYSKKCREIRDNYEKDKNDETFFESMIDLQDRYIESLENKVNQLFEEKNKLLTENVKFRLQFAKEIIENKE